MDPQEKNEEEPDLKRQKLEVDEKLEESSPLSPCSSGSSFSYDSDDVRLFELEFERSGEYDFDESRVGRYKGIATLLLNQKPTEISSSDYARLLLTNTMLIRKKKLNL